ncbi:MAG: ferrous iron transport protein A [Verrucomicrobiae bacterium]|nr:ferrous iron transport protein A [Verrucomicrobiae bacterium]MDW8310816.1 FeoA family protein [Verrucomicrobiales bacterium]
MNSDAMFEAGWSQAQRCELCPLTAVRAGMAVRIRRLCAAPEVQDRLRELGFCEDQIIRLLTDQTNFICQICNARLAISEQLARLIWVEPLVQPASSVAVK